MSTSELLSWIGITLALVVSLLTLFNAAKLKTGVLAMSTYAFGGGMLFLSASYLLVSLPIGAQPETADFVSKILFLVGFILLGFGSWKIYQMSQIK